MIDTNDNDYDNNDNDNTHHNNDDTNHSIIINEHTNNNKHDD